MDPSDDDAPATERDPDAHLPTLTWQPVVDVAASASNPLVAPQVASAPTVDAPVAFQPMALDTGIHHEPAPSSVAPVVAPLTPTTAIPPSVSSVSSVELEPMSLSLDSVSGPGSLLGSSVSSSVSSVELEPMSLSLDSVSGPGPLLESSSVSSSVGPVELEPMSLSLELDDTSTAEPPSTVVSARSSVLPVPVMPTRHRAAPAGEQSGEHRVVASPDPAPVDVRATPPRDVTPLIAHDDTPSAPVSMELPAIQEATPPTVLADEEDASPTAADRDESPAFGVPRLPDRAEQEERRRRSMPAAAPVAAAPVVAPVQQVARRRRRRRWPKLVATMVVLAAVAAVAVVFGRPYLFPSEWDPAARPFADQVESVLGIEFVEPVALISQPTGEYRAGFVADLVPTTAVQAQWRALGLLSGELDGGRVTAALGEFPAAYYSPTDGQVYVDEAARGASRDAVVMQAMATAALDQRDGWSSQQRQRTLDGATTMRAAVERRASVAQAESTFDAGVAQIDPTGLTGLAPVIEYQILAPAVYASLPTPTVGPSAVNASAPPDPSDVGSDTLADVGPSGPSALRSTVLALASRPVAVDTDDLETVSTSMDRSFWYLVLANRLDPVAALHASESMVETALTPARRGGQACVYATFSGGGVDATATVRAALEAWVAAGAAEYAGQFSVLADGTLQVVSCDPGPAFESPSRADVARGLIGWRAAELVTYDAVIASGTTDIVGGFAYAWSFVGNSSVAADVAAMAPSTPPAELAATVTRSVQAIVAPGS